MCVEIKRHFEELGFKLAVRGDLCTVIHPEILPRNLVAETVASQGYCPVMSAQRSLGKHRFTIVPYRKPSNFQKADCEKEEIASGELWRVVGSTRSLVAKDDSPICIQGKTIFKSLSAAKEEMAKDGCTSACSLVHDYAYEAPEGGKALDLGCGAGANAALLLKKGWNVTAVDTLPTALTLFQTSVPSTQKRLLELVNADITIWEFPIGMDLVICVDTLPYIEPSKIKGLLEKIRRALIPNGTFIGTFFFSSEKTKVTGELMSMLGAHLYPRTSLAPTMLEDVGFRVEESSIRDSSDEQILCVQFRAINPAV